VINENKIITDASPQSFWNVSIDLKKDADSQFTKVQSTNHSIQLSEEQDTIHVTIDNSTPELA
jgi:hypothetical protein